ncbi:hypothetical protein P7H98_13040 [Lactococcus lactis]|uniref:beta strand repeat-containing protein n=3 Tax=Lactococcus lactis TaxID=1358 RepID=UPI00289203E4|nr:hypothetical protein [Lactococcus lactis]MDT2944279.1 hypothetical protein [Lactococcus lactis]
MADNYGQWFITKMFTDAEAAAVTSGKQITFKKMIASQDIFTQDDLATLTNSVLGTIDIKQQVNISTVLPSTGSYKVQGVFSNSTVTADYLMNTILLVGSYNGTEFLAAAQVANNAFKMPAASTGEQTIYNIAAQISVSNTATVSLTVDPDSIVTNAGLKVVTDAQVVKDSAQDVKISSLETKDAQNVKTTGNQTIAGIKTFTEKIIGSITGTADKAVALFTGRKLKVKLDSTTDKTFNGTADVTDIGVSGVLQIANGGTGASTRANAFANLATIPYNSVTTTDLDNTANWVTLGNGIMSVNNVSGRLYPTAYGKVINFVYGSNVSQLFISEASGSVYHRQGNAIGWNGISGVVGSGAWIQLSDDSTVVHKTGDENIAGIKTFTEKIIGSITGTAEKAVALVTSRKLKVKLDSTTDKTFNGTADVTDIGVSGVLQIANGGTGNDHGTAVSVGYNVFVTDFTKVKMPVAQVGSSIAQYLINAERGVVNAPNSTDNFRGSMIAYPGDNLVYFSIESPSGSWQGVGHGTYLNGTWTIIGLKWRQTFDTSTTVPITNGGTGASTRANAFANLATIPYNSVTTTDLDNTANWVTLGNGIMSVNNVSGGLYPTAYGKVINFVYGSNVSQLFISEASGSVYHRQGNAIGWNGISGVVGSGAWKQLSDDSTVVHNTGDETIAGAKTFSSPIVGSVTGNAETATKLATARTIGGVSFDGTANINLPGVNTAGNQSTSGNAGSATKFQTPRNLKVKLDSTTDKTFNGTADVTDIGVSGVLQIANGGTGVSDGTVNTTAWAYNADGTDRFTTVYPNLNLLVNSSAKTKDGFFKGFDKVENDYGEVTLKGTNTYVGRELSDAFSIQPRDYKPGDKYTMSMDVMFTSWNFPAETTLTQFWLGQRYTASSDGTITSYKPICSIDLPKDPSQMLNKWIRITQTSTIPPYADPSVQTETLLQTKFNGTREGSFTFRVRKPKQEPGSVATPYMPSYSEVTTADWPSYIGYSNTLKLGKGPTDFTWTQVFTEKSVVPITNGGTGNANGLAVGQSSGAQLRYFDDLNDIATTIQYTLNGETPINAPTDAKSNFGFVIVQTRDDSGSGFAIQRYITTANEEFIRSKIGDPHYYWTDWKQL